MIDLKWIIEEENRLTDEARLKLGDNYMLTIDLLELMNKSIKSFSKENEVAHYFDSQFFKDIFLAVLNIIRRHSLITYFLIRHSIECIALFAYSMEKTKKSDFVKLEDDYGFADIKEGMKEKAFKFIEDKFPEISFRLEGIKEVINTFYSHANIFSAQYNTALIDDRLKLLVFDNYFDEYIRSILLCINDVIIHALRLYIKLSGKYDSVILFEDFEVKLIELEERHNKNLRDLFAKEKIAEFPEIEKISEKLRKKYGRGL